MSNSFFSDEANSASQQNITYQFQEDDHDENEQSQSNQFVNPSNFIGDDDDENEYDEGLNDEQSDSSSSTSQGNNFEYVEELNTQQSSQLPTQSQTIYSQDFLNTQQSTQPSFSQSSTSPMKATSSPIKLDGFTN